MSQRFYLESSGKDSSVPAHVHLDKFPAIIGRHPDCAIQFVLDRLSRTHARIDYRDGRLRIADLGSTNGTFVNHRRVSGAVWLQVGDVVHLADHEFRLMADDVPSMPAALSGGDATLVGMAALPKDFPLHLAAFRDLLDGEKVTSFGQPIVAASGEAFAVELLGRSAHAELDQGPEQLFALASTLNAETRLSRLFRRCSFELASQAGLTMPLFFNTHPTECEDMPMLIDDLQGLRAAFPGLELVFEVHESAVTDLGLMGEVRQELERIDIRLAYDDFGAGQARLLELVEVPPHFLKFDMGLIRDMTSRDSARYRLLAELNRMITDLGVSTVIEGVEDEATAALCREIGIDYLQGFLFGRPRPLMNYHHTEKDSEP